MEIELRHVAKVWVTSSDPNEKDHLAGMLRGLANGISGFSTLRGQTNARCHRGLPLRFRFHSRQKRREFIRVATGHFDEKIVIKKFRTL
ncbi:hypothetical protein GCM10027285_03160 [Oleiagrimonas citrea]